MKIVKKPWGEERWFAVTPWYAGKFLIVKAGRRLSLQYHRVKKETLYIYKGRAKITLENSSGRLRNKVFGPGGAVFIPAGKKHRVEAITHLTIIEVSTPQLDDVVRVEDDYKRQL